MARLQRFTLPSQPVHGRKGEIGNLRPIVRNTRSKDSDPFDLGIVSQTLHRPIAIIILLVASTAFAHATDSFPPMEFSKRLELRIETEELARAGNPPPWEAEGLNFYLDGMRGEPAQVREAVHKMTIWTEYAHVSAKSSESYAPQVIQYLSNTALPIDENVDCSVNVNPRPQTSRKFYSQSEFEFLMDLAKLNYFLWVETKNEGQLSASHQLISKYFCQGVSSFLNDQIQYFLDHFESGYTIDHHIAAKRAKGFKDLVANVVGDVALASGNRAVIDEHLDSLIPPDVKCGRFVGDMDKVLAAVRAREMIPTDKRGGLNPIEEIAACHGSFYRYYILALKRDMITGVDIVFDVSIVALSQPSRLERVDECVWRYWLAQRLFARVRRLGPESMAAKRWKSVLWTPKCALDIRGYGDARVGLEIATLDQEFQKYLRDTRRQR